jgi:hypothetical protein
MSNTNLRTPTRRTCERCGRAERWDAAETTWRVVATDGNPQVGNRYCIHEWDINGTFVPFENGDAAEV